MDLKEAGSDARNWMDLAQDRDHGAYVRCNEPPGSLKKYIILWNQATCQIKKQVDYFVF